MNTLEIIAKYEEQVTFLISSIYTDSDALSDGTLVHQFLQEIQIASDRHEFCGPELTDFLDDAPNLRWQVLLHVMRTI